MRNKKSICYNYLTEEQLYDFMLESRSEKCKKFRKWVVSEVIPSIVRTGGYVHDVHTNAQVQSESFFSFDGEKLKRMRMEAGLSMRELAQRCGVGKTTLCDWENNGVLPKLTARLVKVEQVLLKELLIERQAARIEELEKRLEEAQNPQPKKKLFGILG